jgi:excisionase family DNA binding protein
MKKEVYLSVPETAKQLKCTTKYVYDLLYSGSISATKVEGRWKIPSSALGARLAKRAEK